jgi:hypothetical protein
MNNKTCSICKQYQNIITTPKWTFNPYIYPTFNEMKKALQTTNISDFYTRIYLYTMANLLYF